MAIESEATEIVLKLVLEGTEHFIRIGGEAAGKCLALLFAGVKAIWETNAGKQKNKGRINTKTFLKNFFTGSVFTLKKSDLDALIPEMKRLYIPYMQFKRSKEMVNDGTVDISVRPEDAMRFLRICETQEINVVENDLIADEISSQEYDEITENSDCAEQVEMSVTDEGVTLTNKENPTHARSGPGNPSAQQSEISTGLPDFKPTAGVKENLRRARAMTPNGVILSINRATLLRGQQSEFIHVTIPGTKRKEGLLIPRSDIINLYADNGQTIIANLKPNKLYTIVDDKCKTLRKDTGAAIRESGRWAKKQMPANVRKGDEKWQRR